MLIVLATSPRVAPGLLSWPAWQALRSATTVLAPPGHPALPALDEAGIAYQVTGEPPSDPDGAVVWLPMPGAGLPIPPGARLLRGSAGLPGAHLIDLVATMDRLRVECPWDARQTHASLAPHLLEEPYEALEALESGDESAFREELGDVLLQVVFHARIAAERDDGTGYTIDDVADGIVDKLVRRHPHVFGDVTVSGADEVKRNWDAIKAEERRSLSERQGDSANGQGTPSALDGVPFGQAALALAAQLQRRAARAGVPDELARLDGEAGEDIGAELFRLVARAREAGLDPEMELRAAARRYRDLVRAWERSQRAWPGSPGLPSEPRRAVQRVRAAPDTQMELSVHWRTLNCCQGIRASLTGGAWADGRQEAGLRTGASRASRLLAVGAGVLLALGVLGCSQAQNSATQGSATQGSATQSSAPAEDGLPGWQEVFNGDFNGPAGSGVNTADWEYVDGQGLGLFGTGEVETTTSSPANIHQDGHGDLDIVVLGHGAAGSPGADWTSARIKTKNFFSAPAGGEMMVTASIEQPNPDYGLGYWPGFWMLGTGPWPMTGEIDIMEDVDGLSNESTTLHCGNLTQRNPDGTYGPCHEKNGLSSGLLPCPGCQLSFNTYTVIIDRRNAGDEQIRWYLDGHQIFSLSESQIGQAAWTPAVDGGFQIILDVGVGGSFPDLRCQCSTPSSLTTSPGTMVVQYVRVYTN